jgi:DNA-directed RNA polymerase subunit alpha
MRIRWRGLELPSRVVPDTDTLTSSYGRFSAEPFERGFGATVGNSLRRILLSSLEGAAVTKVRLQGGQEFQRFGEDVANRKEHSWRCHRR